MAIVYFIVTYGFSCLLRSRLLCIRQYFNFCAGLYCRIVENHIHSEHSCYKPRASERARERTQWCEHQQQQTQKQQNRNTTAGCEHHKQRKQKQQNRSNTQHMIIVYIHPLPFRSIAVCIGVRTAILHRCSHLTFIPPSCIGVRTLHVTIAVRCLVVFSYRQAVDDDFQTRS